ncbi:FeMo cofactor biosynthesis protein NifB [Psychromonas marina]|uniref:FeMo cofactor biosynthesis protein NifB n=1 Tax=Psychromonas marina TaxID=88364 RepID=A0ABQ6E543_9GAMM|nr:nitrogenase cofactor biosynthesis protein NifB [Psychromonas marina]GLS92538.1 FeMo cofactor biosynthesis protein NifB [Psychromonas marina]
MDNNSDTTKAATRPSCKSKCESDTLTSNINLSKERRADATPAGVKQKVINHPCYSNDAHHKYARMHLPVAPACNIQCNYCNRKYDCANESRPGVVSELLTPKQALLKAQAVAKAIPQLSVIGIAGPGDPLANPVRTMETLALIRAAMPDIKLCISTNGLTLVDHVDELLKLGVDHVTVTINTLDEVIAAQIYKWIYFEGRRYEGVEAGRILIQRQMEGIAALAKEGILTKVNSVMIPGINDGHLPELSRELRRNKVFLHNIMPLISKPEHGTFFGLVGQREPLTTELDEVRELAGGNVSQMKHCQQCRADAVGMLEEDRSAEFSIEDINPEPEDYTQTMAGRCRFQSAVISKGVSETEASLVVAVATKNSEQIDLHFGHADCFKLYLVTKNQHHFIGERRITRYCSGDNHEQSIETNETNLQTTIKALHGVDLVLCCRIGTPPSEALAQENIRVVIDYAYHAIDVSLADIYSRYAPLAHSKWQARQKVEQQKVEQREVI